MRNLIKKIRENKPVVGTWMNSGSHIMAELLSNVGFDFVCVDAEHSAVDLTETQQLFQAICAGNPDCCPMVRLHGVDYSFVKRYMDAGARAVVGPLVNTKEEAQLLADAVYYPPHGKRGVGFCRANQYGLNLNEEVANSHNELLVAVQIEHIEGVKNIEEILDVEGINAVFIGPYDLSASMNLIGQFDHPDFIAARNKILEACKRRNVIAGVHIIQPDAEELVARYEEGYRLLAYSLDITMVLNHSKKGLEYFKSKI
jgi:2-dehydro-3-deoxyglucarate aldolase